MQLAANFTYWKQAPCPRGLIRGVTQQVRTEKATNSFCRGLMGQWGPSNEGCTAAADGWKIRLNCLLKFFFLSKTYLASFMPGTPQSHFTIRCKNYIIHSTTHRQRIQNEPNHSLQPSPFILCSAKQNTAAPPGQLWAPLLLCRGSLLTFWFVLGSFISIANGRDSSGLKAAALTGVSVTGSKLSAVQMKDARWMTPGGGPSANGSHG